MHTYSTDNGFRTKLLALLGIIAYLFAGFLNSVVFPAFEGWVAIHLPTELNIGASFMLVFGAIFWAFSNHVWHRSWIPERIVSVPDLTGHWEGHIKTQNEVQDEYINVELNDDNDEYTPMEATLDISQDWRKISIYFATGRSPSPSTGAMFRMKDMIHPKVAYLFQNQGPAPDEQADDEGQYDGTAQFRYIKRPDEPDILEGKYYTGPSRGNQGSARFERKADSPKSGVAAGMFDQLLDRLSNLL